MPLLSTNEVSRGKQFPPERETERHNLMFRYYQYSRGVFTGLRSDEDAEGSRLPVNLFAGVMEFWKQAVLGDRPIIEFEGNARADEWFKSIQSNFFDAAETVVGDVIRYGIGLFYSDPVVGWMGPQSLDPLFWFPIRPPSDLYSMENPDQYMDVVAYAYNDDNEFINTNNKILIKIFGLDGSVERRVHKFEGTVIGPVLKQDEYRAPPVPIVPVRLSDDFYGISDYRDMEKYVAELHRRESGISKALDRHANPHLAIPESSIVANTDGTITIDKEGIVIPFDNQVRLPPQYIVWDAKFDAQDSAIVRAENRALTSSKISPILYRLSAGDSLPNIVSGAALRRLSIPTVNKIKTMRRRLNAAFKEVLMQQAQVYQVMTGEMISIEPEKIKITWQTELSTGFTDDAEALSQLVGSGILTKESANKLVEVDGKPAEEVQNGSSSDERQAE